MSLVEVDELDAGLAQEAGGYGRSSRLTQGKNLKRAIPASRDDALCKVHVTAALVRYAEEAIDRDEGLVAWIEERVQRRFVRPGRPAALSTRSLLVCLWLLAVTQRSFHLINLPPLIASMEPSTRRRLGLDYRPKPYEPKFARTAAGAPASIAGGQQVTYSQLWTAFSNIADAFDSFADTLSEEEALERAGDLQKLVNRLVRASVWDRAHKGDYAADATLVWAWDRPRRSSNKKIERRGRDGDAGRPVPLSSVIELEELADDDLEHSGLVEDPLLAARERGVIACREVKEAGDAENGNGTDDVLAHGDGAAHELGEDRVDQRDGQDEMGEGGPSPSGGPPSPFAPEGSAPAKKERRRGRPSTWGKGAQWVGRGKNKSKSVYGYALHTVSVTDPTQPAVIEAIALTPAPAMPAPSVVPLLRLLHDARTADPDVQQAAVRPIGNVVADGVYSLNVERWQLPIRALGGDTVFRLHSTMQAGRRVVRGTTFLDGGAFCDCVPDTLAELRFPKFPFSAKALDTYTKKVIRRATTFEMKPNGGYLANGSRQFKSPHFCTPGGGAPGGCIHCVDAYGRPVVTPATGVPRPRCCTKRTKTFSAKELALYQPEVYGSPAWQGIWNPRNRVEGDYGVLKNLALVNWGHGYHHFVGLARENLVAAFAVMALNFHIQRTWKARKDLTDPEPPPRPDDRMPSRAPLQLTPQGVAAARRECEAAEREAKRRRGPKGLEILGTSPSAP